jgi:hypothetical protein
MLQHLSELDIGDCRKHEIPFFLSLSNLSSPGKIYNVISAVLFVVPFFQVTIMCLRKKEIAWSTKEDLRRNTRTIVNVRVALLVVVELFVALDTRLVFVPAS